MSRTGWNAVAFLEFLDALMHRPSTTRALVGAAGVNAMTVGRWLHMLHDRRPRRAHIELWTRCGTRWTPMWLWGPGDDALCPRGVHQSNAAACRRYRERKRDAKEKARDVRASS